MIRHIKLLRNTGTFHSDSATTTTELKPLVLIYAENGLGKTTLAAILQSLSTGNAVPILERRRLGSSEPPHIVLECEGPLADVVFKDGAWNHTLPQMRVFDDFFVDRNVHSGLNVEAGHRQNLHDLILGERGVDLNERLQVLAASNEEHNRALRLKAAGIPEESRHGFSVEDFCALPNLNDVDAQIAAKEASLNAARNQDAVLSAPMFDPIKLPAFDIEAIHRVLQLDITGLSAEAENHVQAHVRKLGDEGEAWVANGMGLAQLTEGKCPFCGQALSTSNLIDHYRMYFSQGYARLKQDVAEMIEQLCSIHSEGKHAEFERAVRIVGERQRQWDKFLDLPSIEINTSPILHDWNNAFNSILSILQMKQNAPLERHVINEDVQNLVAAYGLHRSSMEEVNKSIIFANAKIREVQQQVQEANVDHIVTELARLKAIRARHSDHLALLCTEYLEEKEAKAQTERARDDARSALSNYRAKVFPALQEAVNTYLPRFNAGFRIAKLAPTNIGSGSSSTYSVVINERPVAIGRKPKSVDAPTFRNTLSAGDRNTLALALFFSTLDQDPRLADTIVVIDDPITSLDEYRSLTTAQEIRKLAQRTSQVIVLSHSKAFLCRIWDHSNRANVVALEIKRAEEGSSITEWNVSEEALTEHDRRHKALQEFYARWLGEEREIARHIREHLEGYLRVTCPAEFPPGKSIGPLFIKECWQRLNEGSPILPKDKLQELGSILEYASGFYHDTNPAWQTEAINAQELHGFVGRTLAFVKP